MGELPKSPAKTDAQLHNELRSPGSYKAAKEELVRRIGKPVVMPGDEDMLKQRTMSEELRKEL